MNPTEPQMVYGNMVHPWDPPGNVTIERCGGPERVVTDKPDPEFTPYRVGFTAERPENPEKSE